MSRDPRVDDYIASRANFARPILEQLRAWVHAACPDCEEAIKWGMPAFLYKGKQVAGMGAFKAHAAFGFWNRAQVRGEETKSGAMGDFGRITSLADLPSEAEFADMVSRAMAAVDAGAKTVRARTAKPAIEMPDDLAAALAANAAAQASFDGFPPGCRREYLEWVIGAKRTETRQKRIREAVSMMAEGKRRHWKYEPR